MHGTYPFLPEEMVAAMQPDEPGTDDAREQPPARGRRRGQNRARTPGENNAHGPSEDRS